MKHRGQPPRVLISDYRTADISAEIPYLFHKAGSVVEVYCAETSWLRKNNYHHKWHQADVSTPEKYVAGLNECARRQKYDWIILTEDEAIRAVNNGSSSDTVGKIINFRATSEGQKLGFSKAEFSQICHRHGIVTPKFLIYEPGISLESVEHEVGFPLVAKVDCSSGGDGVFLCASVANLAQTISTLPVKKTDKLVLQKYIRGTNLSCEALFKDGALLASATARVVATTGNEFNVSSGRVYQRDSRVEELLGRIGPMFNFDGFYNLTFMEDEADGLLYFIEADMRPNIWFSLVRFAGVDFSLAVRRYLSLDAPGPSLVTLEKPTLVWHFHRDINRALAEGDFKTLFLWIMNDGGRWRFIPFYDQKLLFGSVAFIWRSTLFRLGNRYPIARRTKWRLRSWLSGK